MDGMEVLKQPTFRKLTCWLFIEAEADWGGRWDFAQYGGLREWDVLLGRLVVSHLLFLSV